MTFLNTLAQKYSVTGNMTREDKKKLEELVNELMKDSSFDYNKKFSEFKNEALKRANEKGLRVIGIEVMQMLDKILEKKSRKLD